MRDNGGILRSVRRRGRGEGGGEAEGVVDATVEDGAVVDAREGEGQGRVWKMHGGDDDVRRGIFGGRVLVMVLYSIIGSLVRSLAVRVDGEEA